MFTKRLALKSFYFSLDNWWSYCANLHIFRWRSHISSNTISFPLLSLISCHFTPFFCLIRPPYSSSLFWFSTVYYLLRPTLPPHPSPSPSILLWPPCLIRARDSVASRPKMIGAQKYVPKKMIKTGGFFCFISLQIKQWAALRSIKKIRLSRIRKSE